MFKLVKVVKYKDEIMRLMAFCDFGLCLREVVYALPRFANPRHIGCSLLKLDLSNFVCHMQRPLGFTFSHPSD